ncbi:MAG: antibiotic biosynthesis monooxygenase [Betaproteobacteria bacterium]|nr:antibiotic biosynthesis monooxygenase [Betaproteobacteria bacterium]
MFSKTPPLPYYAVIFSSRLSSESEAYREMADKMAQLAALQPGFLGCESVRGENGFGITVSYWSDEKAIAGWKANAEHRIAQEIGKRSWYEHYEIRIAKVERAYGK